MKSILPVALIMVCSMPAFAQTIPPKANMIIVKGIGLKQVCSALIDSGYIIDRKDNDLQTAITEIKEYPKSWNAGYSIYVRVKDSIAYFSAKYTAPLETFLVRTADKKDPLWDKEKAYYHTNKKGEVYPKSLPGMPFMWMNNFVKSFNRPIEYMIQK